MSGGDEIRSKKERSVEDTERAFLGSPCYRHLGGSIYAYRKNATSEEIIWDKHHEVFIDMSPEEYTKHISAS